MTFGGVPILDWVLLLVVLGFGVEAYITTRHKDDDDKDARPTGNAGPEPPPAKPSRDPPGDDPGT